MGLHAAAGCKRSIGPRNKMRDPNFPSAQALYELIRLAQTGFLHRKTSTGEGATQGSPGGHNCLQQGCHKTYLVVSKERKGRCKA